MSETNEIVYARERAETDETACEDLAAWAQGETGRGKKEVHIMPVIYLDERRRLTEEQKQMATILASNEINDVMADLEILEEELSKTCLFKDFPVRELALKHLSKFEQNEEHTSFSKEVLAEVYKHYFAE